MADVFLSYSSKDRAAAERVQQALERAGLDVFWDQEIPAGTDWDTWIRAKLSGAKAAVVLWSKASIESPNVRHEAMIARDAGKLVPAMIETLSPSDFPMGLYLVQGVQLQDWRSSGSGGMARLVEEVRAKLGRGEGAGREPPKHAGKIKAAPTSAQSNARVLVFAVVALALVAVAGTGVVMQLGKQGLLPPAPPNAGIEMLEAGVEKGRAAAEAAKSLPKGDGFAKRMLGRWRTVDGQACKDGTNVTFEDGKLVFTAPGSRYVHAIVADAPLRTQTSVKEPAEHRGEEYVLTPEFFATSDERSFTLIVENATTGTRDTWDPCEV
jgi:hypothetical protein